MDNIFFTTILFIFVTALIGAVLRSRKSDKCLRSFEEFHVTLEEKDGNLVWGKLFVYSTGLELTYAKPVQDLEGHIESSYIIYKEQFKEIQAIYRYYDELTPENKIRREKTIQKTLNPNVFRKHGRRFQNVINTFRDAFMQSVGIVIGQMKKSHPGSMILKTQEEKLSEVGKQFIGYVGTAFDPILENYIGKKVVLEITKGDVTTEFPGVLREYSAEFLEVLNINRKIEKSFVVKPNSQKKLSFNLAVTYKDCKVAIENKGESPVFIKEVVGNDKAFEMNVVANPNTVADMPICEELGEQEIEIVVEMAKEMDIVVPRTHALIRHSSEGEMPNKELDILRKLPVS